MQIVRTLIWVILLIVLLAFSWANWDQDVNVRIWDGLVWDTKLPAVAILAFLAGLIPMWLYHRAARWSHARRVKTLEANIRSAELSAEQQRRAAEEQRRAASPPPREDASPVAEPAPAPTPTTPPADRP